MKKTFLALALIILTGGAAFGQTQTISILDGTGGSSGTYDLNASFNLTTSVTFSGYSANGLSYWLQVPSNLANFITITNAQYTTFTDGNQTDYPKAFTDTVGATSGFLSDKGSGTLSGDLGGSAAGTNPTEGTYPVTTLTFKLTGAPIGTYLLETTTVSPKLSEVNDADFTGHNLPMDTYTITVVPEPSSWALLAAGVGVLGISIRLRRRTA